MNNAIEALRNDPSVIGLAVAGSWLTNEIDEFSDVDLVLVTKEKISNDRSKMMAYAQRLGKFLSGFTGEHVGEPRVLICLYDDPLLHVDIKFVTLEEFWQRIETPVILLDTQGQLQAVLDASEATSPYPDYQWIEDRFWTWIHYALLKIGRGEYMEAFDFFGALRMMVLGPLVHTRNGNLPRGVRKVEAQLPAAELELLKSTLPQYSKESFLKSLENAVALYRGLRKDLFPPEIQLHPEVEEKVMEYFDAIRQRS
ncbi:MAG TPA: nucleotidyltransferase domain-containing protein [Chitinophagaceae bacterium]|nr:nucleotidyltransferase domain-containing protein [Chitinophagaceae bacterium]